MNRPSRSRSPRASRSLRARIAFFSVGEERQLQLGYVRIMYIYLRARRYAYTQEGTRTASLLMTSFWNFKRERERDGAELRDERRVISDSRWVSQTRYREVERTLGFWSCRVAIVHRRFSCSSQYSVIVEVIKGFYIFFGDAKNEIIN